MSKIRSFTQWEIDLLIGEPEITGVPIESEEHLDWLAHQVVEARDALHVHCGLRVEGGLR